MPAQFPDSNSPISVLHSTKLYSLFSSLYFRQSSLSVSWQRTYNTFTLDKSSNHTLIILLIYDDLVLQFNLQSGPVLATGCRYIDAARTTQKTVLLRHTSVGVTRDHYLGSPMARWLLLSNEP
jgi:hypothetical protein